MQIRLIDANNVLRREWEHVDPTKTRARVTFEEALTENALQIWVWDGYNHNARRREVFPEYKMKRLPAKEDMYAGLDLMREILSHSKATQIEVPLWEADDVIATLAHRYASPDIDLRIMTNDLDYYQLANLDGVTLDGVRPAPFNPDYICLYKTLVGDPSDNIPGLPGFGPKKFDNCSVHWVTLKQAFTNKDAATIRSILGEQGPRFQLALQDDAQIEALYAYWTIVHMMEVPWEEIEANTTVGKYNSEAAEALFRKFML